LVTTSSVILPSARRRAKTSLTKAGWVDTNRSPGGTARNGRLAPLVSSSRKQDYHGHLPDCTVVRNRKNPAIIHIIETTLTRKDDYVMHRKVDVTYSGVLGGVSGPLAEETGKGLDDGIPKVIVPSWWSVPLIGT
jgi:hypothetical protein